MSKINYLQHRKATKFESIASGNIFIEISGQKMKEPQKQSGRKKESQ